MGVLNDTGWFLHSVNQASSDKNSLFFSNIVKKPFSHTNADDQKELKILLIFVILSYPPYCTGLVHFCCLGFH